MITAIHTLVYADDPDATRAFGITTEIVVPGTSQALMLYQPRYDPPALAD